MKQQAFLEKHRATRKTFRNKPTTTFLSKGGSDLLGIFCPPLLGEGGEQGNQFLYLGALEYVDNH